MTRIVVHIDKLVLRGVDQPDARTVSARVQAELQRLLAQPGALGALAGAGVAPVAHAAGGHAIGQAIAGGIARGVKS